jgi:hypothetical protein
MKAKLLLLLIVAAVLFIGLSKVGGVAGVKDAASSLLSPGQSAPSDSPSRDPGFTFRLGLVAGQEDKAAIDRAQAAQMEAAIPGQVDAQNKVNQDQAALLDSTFQDRVNAEKQGLAFSVDALEAESLAAQELARANSESEASLAASKARFWKGAAVAGIILVFGVVLALVLLSNSLAVTVPSTRAIQGLTQPRLAVDKTTGVLALLPAPLQALKGALPQLMWKRLPGVIQEPGAPVLSDELLIEASRHGAMVDATEALSRAAEPAKIASTIESALGGAAAALSAGITRGATKDSGPAKSTAVTGEVITPRRR